MIIFEIKSVYYILCDQFQIGYISKNDKIVNYLYVKKLNIYE